MKTVDKKIQALKRRQSKNVDAAVKKNAKFDKKIFALAYEKLLKRIKNGRPWQPTVGDLIYAPTHFYLGHGKDDIAGGLATITGIKDDGGGTVNSIFVTLKEINSSSNWSVLLEDQKEHMKRYGKEFAHPDPDMCPEFNDDGFGDWR